MKPPCKGCPERHELCHAECEKYIAYRADRDRHCAERAVTWNVNDIREEAYIKRRKSLQRKGGR